MTKTIITIFAASMLTILLSIGQVSHAEEKLCSTPATQETVIRLFQQGFYSDATAAFVLDHDQTSMKLEAIRTADQTPSKYVCRATVSVDLIYKEGYEKMRKFANPVKSEIGYTVEITDDGQQYVTLGN